MWLEVIFVLFAVLCYFHFFHGGGSLLKGFPGPPTLPLVGNALDFIRLGNVTQNTLPFLSSLVDQYGPRTKFSLGPMTFAVLSSPQDIQKVLGSTVHTDKGTLYDFITDWLGYSLLTSKGERWTTQRKLLTPAFHYEILKQFLPTMNEQSRLLVDILKEHARTGEYFDAAPLLTNAALDIICETAMGRKVNAQTDPNCPYGKAVHAVSTIIQERIFRPWLHPNFIWRISSLGRECQSYLNVIHSFTRQVIKEKKEERKGRLKKPEIVDDVYGTKKQAFLDLLLQVQEDNPQSLFTDQDILNEVSTFMFGGHDSTAQFFSWALLELGNHPEIQSLLHEELDSIFERDRSRSVTLDDLRQMENLEMVIKETLRLHPVLPSIMRQINSPCTLEERTTIDKGVTAWIFIHGLHRDSTTFPSPLTFDHTRFSLENSSQRHPYSFLPFSAGPRNCIGQKFAMQEVKTVLAYICRNFTICTESLMTSNPSAWELTLKPVNGVRIKLIQRPS